MARLIKGSEEDEVEMVWQGDEPHSNVQGGNE